MASGLKLWGILGTSAIVLSNDSPTLVKAAAKLAKVVFHDRIQICNGVDDQVEIQAAIDALPDGAPAGQVRLLGGTFYISAPIVLKAYMALVGQGMIATRLYLVDGADCDVLTIAGIAGFMTIREFEIHGNNSNQGGASNGIYLPFATSGTVIENVRLYQIRDTALYIYETYYFTARGLVIHGVAAPDETVCGVHIRKCGICHLDNLNIALISGAGIWIEAAAGEPTSAIAITAPVFEDVNKCLELTGPTDEVTGISMDGAVAAGSIQQLAVLNYSERCSVTNFNTSTITGASALIDHPGSYSRISGTAEAAGSYGVVASAGRIGLDIDVTIKSAGMSGVFLSNFHASKINAIVTNAQQHGIQVDACSGILITGVCWNNGQAVGNFGGLTVDNSEGIVAVGGRYFDDQGTPTQRYGIYERGTSDYNTYKGNDVRGNLTQGISVVGAHNTYDQTPTSIALDLTGGATDIEVFHSIVPCMLVGYQIVYSVATGVGAGVNIRVGRYQDGVPLDDDYFDVIVSEASKAKGYSLYVPFASLTQTVVAAGDTITVGTAGAKADTGEVIIILQIAEMAD